MDRRKWLSWVIGTSVVSSGLMATPGKALPPNQSDITGTNIWNNTAPIFEEEGKLSPAILDEARRLDEALENASEQCCNVSKPVAPRRFSRTPPDPNRVCSNPDCVELDSLVEETRDFLDDVDRLRAEQVRANRNRLW
ncbi:MULTISPECIES: hypothetical protein [unclassified Coleofasciculus]|uniref:hypothetical protein n=1 Tax=unclassified Coleofasciculus TaxID=2692782 RepID=UPI00188290B7|nr:MULTISPECIES: hypothetical protein [unclassified Coleofasciculus]MBE9127562.1 hypothetical protein [Coleofasciculus sp. LEGE 07081]MBE9147194.1 hypothetical protein [Coleofasciculus sp. LEGE 07092]